MSKEKLTASEWELVKNAPYWVNHALAEADGRVPFLVSRREGKALEKALKGYKTGNALIRDIIADEDDAPKEIGKASAAETDKAINRIAAIVEEKLGADDLAELRGFLLKIGREVAESAGEGSFGRGEKVSEKESAALARLESAMKVSTSFATAHMATQPKPAAKPSTSAKPVPAAKPEPIIKPAAEDDEARKKAEQAKNREEARKRQEQAHAESEARKKAEAEERQREAEAKAKADAEAAAAREEAARKEAEAKAAAAKYTQFIAEHTVQPGDNLSFISQKYYGHQGNFRIIYEANKDVIGDNMNLIRPGQVLRIPK
ncbi:MAG TPA: LysM peptidoglycan-binding domain-containing protein, partial [Promineifilum sp.]|nr:LysM peptidoglycan-binding domain-containing protein [Promineifilum sp.]